MIKSYLIFTQNSSILRGFQLNMKIIINKLQIALNILTNLILQKKIYQMKNYNQAK